MGRRRRSRPPTTFLRGNGQISCSAPNWARVDTIVADPDLDRALAATSARDPTPVASCAATSSDARSLGQLELHVAPTLVLRGALHNVEPAPPPGGSSHRSPGLRRGGRPRCCGWISALSGYTDTASTSSMT